MPQRFASYLLALTAAATLAMPGAVLAEAELRAKLPDFADLVDSKAPAVVNISTLQEREGDPRGMPEGMPEGFPEEFPPRGYGGPGDGDEPPAWRLMDRTLTPDFAPGQLRTQQRPPRPPGPGREGQSLGSGFITSKDGQILTNYHVVQNADEIIVRLADGREHKAEIVGADEHTDIAVLQIKADGDLPTVEVGNSQGLRRGEWVVAIGSPFGFEHSVTAGIVSAKGRSLPQANYTPYIQTDVAINPGNSGGPLFNLDGQVVGVNSQIYSQTGGFMGLSFAIPIELAMDVGQQLVEKGRVERGWLGVLIQDVTRDLAESFGLERPRGALISEVVPDSPAEGAGFQAGDVILAFQGEEIGSSGELPPMVGRQPADTEVEIKILRDGEEKTLTVLLKELPDDAFEARPERPGPPDEPGPERPDAERLGLVVEPLGDEEREALGVPGGVVVTEVRDGPAAEAGIEPGDVITSLAQQEVRDPEQFKGLVDELPGDQTVPILVYRGENPQFLALHMP